MNTKDLAMNITKAIYDSYMNAFNNDERNYWKNQFQLALGHLADELKVEKNEAEKAFFEYFANWGGVRE